VARHNRRYQLVGQQDGDRTMRRDVGKQWPLALLLAVPVYFRRRRADNDVERRAA
jgi:hypothetical protein